MRWEDGHECEYGRGRNLFKVLTLHSPRHTEGKTKSFTQDTR